jgi:hypothetical protein
LFVNTPIGHHQSYLFFRLGDGRTVSLFQTEKDPLVPGGSIAGMGRRILLQVLNPSPRGHLVLSVTDTLKGDGENRLPPASIIAADRVGLPIIGRGSARVFSPPVDTLEIAGRSFLGIDMGVDGVRFPDHRTGVMTLFGTDVVLDRRLLTAFARDVSFISDAELATITPPSVVQRFPADLLDPDLEYSGMYEDGWISEASFFGLAAPAEHSTVVVRGTIPLIDDPAFQTELTLLVDGQEVRRQRLGVGAFELHAPAPDGPGRRRVELRFSAFQRLPGMDRRPAAAHVESIGLEAAPAASPVGPNAARAGSILSLPADLGRPDLVTAGVSADGWVEGGSSFEIFHDGTPAEVVVRGLVPLVNDPDFTTTLDVLIDGRRAGGLSLGPGDFELRAPVPAGPDRRRIELRFSATQTLPAPDGRQVGASIETIGFDDVSAAGAPSVSAAAATPQAQQPATPLAPSALARFPADVENPAAGVTGIAADGWLLDVASAKLTQPGGQAVLVVKGMVPRIDDAGFTTDLRVLVDGQEIGRQTLAPGDFELRAGTQTGAGPHVVELRFSATQQLPAPDSRWVGARLASLAFEGGSAATGQVGAAPVPALPREALPADFDSAEIGASGLDSDGWLAASSSFALAQVDPSSTLVVRGMVPLIADSGFATEIRVMVDGREIARSTLGLGDFELRAPAPAGSARRRVEVQFSRTQVLPAPDGRHVGARLELLQFE